MLKKMCLLSWDSGGNVVRVRYWRRDWLWKTATEARFLKWRISNSKAASPMDVFVFTNPPTVTFIKQWMQAQCRVSKYNVHRHFVHGLAGLPSWSNSASFASTRGSMATPPSTTGASLSQKQKDTLTELVADKPAISDKSHVMNEEAKARREVTEASNLCYPLSEVKTECQLCRTWVYIKQR